MTETSSREKRGSCSRLASTSRQTRAFADLRKIPTVKGAFKYNCRSMFCADDDDGDWYSMGREECMSWEMRTWEGKWDEKQEKNKGFKMFMSVNHHRIWGRKDFESEDDENFNVTSFFSSVLSKEDSFWFCCWRNTLFCYIFSTLLRNTHFFFLERKKEGCLWRWKVVQGRREWKGGKFVLQGNFQLPLD